MAENPTPSAAEEHATVEWIYIGRRHGGKGQLAHWWLKDPAHDEPDAVAYSKLEGGVIGGVYQITLATDGMVYIGGEHGPRYLRQSNNPRRNAWALAQRHASATVEQERLEKKLAAESRDLGQMTMREVAVWYGGLFPTRRGAALGLLIDYIVGRRG